MTNTTPPQSRLSQFFAELKRRHVVRFALGYAAVAFVVLQLAEIIFPAFQIGEVGLRVLVVAVALLFPPAMVLAWIYDITTEGIERTSETPGTGRGRLLPGIALLVLTVGIVASVGVWLQREGVLEEPVATQRQRSGTRSEPTLVAYDPSQAIRSLAVLPLDDFSGDGQSNYFTLGLQEELIAQLSQLAGLRVVSRTSVQRYAASNASVPAIGRDLQVDALIEGSVRRSDGQVRITLQLIHAASDTHVWTQQYDRALENVLALQSEVALDIAEQIRAGLSDEETSVLRRVASRSWDPEAQDAYLRGRFEAEKGTPEGLVAARDLFATAVEEDSSFAPALTQLAGTRFLIGLADSAGFADETRIALSEVQRALALDSTSAEAQEVLELINRHLPGAHTARVVVGERPRTIPGRPAVAAPEVADTLWFQAMTQMGRQIEEMVRSREIPSPESSVGARIMGARQLMAAGLFDEAADMIREVVTAGTAPRMAWELLARAEVADGDPEEAASTMAEWGAQGGTGAPDEASVASLEQAVDQDGEQGFWRWTLMRLEERRARGDRVSPTDIAAAQAGAGDIEGAFESLEQALAMRDRALLTLRNDPVWDTLRADRRFADIARRSRTIHLDRMPRAPGDGSAPRRR